MLNRVTACSNHAGIAIGARQHVIFFATIYLLCVEIGESWIVRSTHICIDLVLQCYDNLLILTPYIKPGVLIRLFKHIQIVQHFIVTPD